MDLGGDFGLNSLRRLKSLCKMLRDDADKILTGEMSVTITSRTLCELNEAVDNLQDGLSPPHLSLDMKDGRPSGSQASDLEEWNFHLQLVLDIVSKAPVLVLYRGKEYRETTPALQAESSAPVSQPIRLGYFTSLSHLEISYIPIQSIQDLLKMRERLETLVVTNCFSTNFRLQDVLEMCDQEVSVPMQWAALRHLCLRCDNLTELDGSLRLCPRLEMVDLSRNRLSTTEVYLGYLMELTYVDLSYNVLTVLPSFSATAKKKLRVLLLAGNKLVDLLGVEDMLSLEELDVSENLISSHRCLLPVRALYRLDKLNMKDCPASMRKDHRLLALQHISTVSLSRKFSLDNRLVTPKEIQNSRAALIHCQYITHRREPRRTADHPDGTSETIQNRGDQHPTTKDVTVNFSSTHKKKKAKAHMTEIPDMDTSTGGDFSSRDVTPSGTPKTPSRMEALAQLRRLEVQEKRAELEHLRRYYGDSWLQAVEDQAVLPRPASFSAVAHTTDSASEGAAETSQSSRKPAGKEDNSMTVVVELHNGVARKSELQSADSRKSTAASRRLGDPAEGAFHKDAMFLSSESGAEDGGSSDVPTQASARLQPCGDDLHADDDSRRTEETLLSGNSQLAAGKDRSKAEEKDRHVKKGEELPGLWDSLHDTMIEPEDQSDPFIVTLPDNPDGHLIITVSPRYLVEKDINGAIQDKLDLQCLQLVRVEVEEVQSRPGEAEGIDDTVDISLKEVRVFLDFSYVRKDRRCRVYVMEDFITAQHFMELVQPFMDAKVEAAMKKEQVQYQCLKCSGQFSKAQAHTVVPLEGIPRTGSSKDFKSMADIGGKKVVLRCPKCSSYHVVRLEAGAEHSHATLASSLPADDAHRDSFVRKQSFDQLIVSQSPKAHSTPLKQQNSGLDAQVTRSAAERTGSMPRAFRSLFGADDQDHRQVGDSPDPAPSVGPSESSLSKQEGERLPKGRQRSNAFYNEPLPMESRHRSSAIGSLAEFVERQTERSSGSILSHSSDVERTRSSASNSFTSVDMVGSSQLATFGALNSLHLAPPSTSGVLLGTASSVVSDVSVLNKRESVASVVVLSTTASAEEMLHADAMSNGQGESESLSGETSKVWHPVGSSGGRSRESDPPVNDHASSAERGRATGAPPETESLEATPMGSPLSSSICSSMVSSVYHNSLLPLASASSDYITASDISLAGEAGDATGEGSGVGAEIEKSIYDQSEETVRSRSPPKVSVSSEVEVLLVEESLQSAQVWEHQEDGGTNQASPALTAAPVVSSDSHARGSEGYDFRHINHHMTLYLMMSVFDNDEEFRFKVKSCVCQYMMSEEYEALVIVTNMKLYILRINTEDVSVELSEALTLMEAQPHAELQRVDVGLGSQTLRLEYLSDCSSYTLVLRDSHKVHAFKDLLSDHLQTYAMETGIPMSVVVNDDVDQQTLDNLNANVLTRGGQADCLRLYILGYIARGHHLRQPMAFVVSSSQVCLVKTNHQWPSPHQQAPVTVDTVGKQFTVLERQKINNIATMEKHEEDQHRLRITFFNESSGDETQWLVTMETETGVMAMVEAVRDPWEEAFGVEMDVEVSAFELSF